MIDYPSGRFSAALQSWTYGRLRGVCHPQLHTFFHTLLPLESHPRAPGTRVYRERPNLVQEVILPAHLGVPWSRLVVKSFGWRGIQHYWFSPLKRSKAMKAYRVACHLHAHGLHTPVPVGVFEERRWGFVRSNVYATEALTEAITLRQYCASLPDGVAGLHDVMQLVATYTRCLHDSGVWHRDMVAPNFLLSGPPGHRQVSLIDLNRAWRLPYVPGWIRAIDLARLPWREGQPQFCAFYCTERFSPRLFVWIIRLYGHWRAWRNAVRRCFKARRPAAAARSGPRLTTPGDTP